MKAEKQPQIQPMPFDFLAGIPDSSQLRTNAFYLSFVLHPLAFCHGAVAQLGERLNGIQEVVGSTPIGSTKFLFRKNLEHWSIRHSNNGECDNAVY